MEEGKERSNTLFQETCKLSVQISLSAFGRISCPDEVTVAQNLRQENRTLMILYIYIGLFFYW